MKQILVAFLVSLVPSFGVASECGCDFTGNLSIRQLIEADLVFKGHVITKRTEVFPDLGYRFVATFFIDELISWPVGSDTVDIEFG